MTFQELTRERPWLLSLSSPFLFWDCPESKDKKRKKPNTPDSLTTTFETVLFDLRHNSASMTASYSSDASCVLFL